MTDTFIYYLESNLFCAIMFVIMLAHDLLNVDRQEKQLKYDHALVAFILYFISDSLRAGVEFGAFPVTGLTVIASNLANCVLLAAVTYMWLRYAMAVEQVPYREQPKSKLILSVPFLAAIAALILLHLLAPTVLIDGQMKPTAVYRAIRIAVPVIYIIVAIFYALQRARREENPIEKRRHLYIGFFPLLVVAGGLAQLLLVPHSPIFCFCCTILMLAFYIQSMDRQISTDPLTKLNNRGQLMRYVSQKSNMVKEGRETAVVMLDVNDFKSINDTYGHAEGDRALIIIADALRAAVRSRSMPIFIARYGGDEFILVAHPAREEELGQLIAEIHSRLTERCRAEETPYTVAVSAGYDLLRGEKDSFQKCAQRADERLYEEKRRIKTRGASPV